MQTATVPRIAPAWQQAVVHRVHTNEKVVALTYDDGPHPVFTPEILRILDKYHVKATFFMIGKRMEDHPEVVKEILDDGHAIGNHTYTHPGNLERDTRKQVTRELMECETVIERIIGERTRLFRPPKGLIDGTIFTIAEDEGYQTILWTVSADHHDAPTPQAMADRVLKHVVPGAIILAHDGTVAGRWKDVAATPLIIESLRKKGYRFVTLPELLKLGLPATPPAQPDTEAKP
jgi:peptidoglycan/xylan/chitin deacetylase (PgdA/CDA1 family)